MTLRSLFVSFMITVAAGSSALAAPPVRVGSQYETWEARLRARVIELHHFPLGAEKGAMGDVLVNFAIGADGRPADIGLSRSSGQAIFDRAALRLVAGLGRLSAVPTADGVSRRVTLKLSYGEPSSVASQVRANREMNDERAFHTRRNLAIVTSEVNTAANR